MCAGIRDADIDVDAFDDGYFGALAEAKGVDPAVTLAASTGRGPLRLLDLQIRTGPWGDRYGEVPDGLTLQSFLDAPHGIDQGPMIRGSPRSSRRRTTASTLPPRWCSPTSPASRPGSSEPSTASSSRRAGTCGPTTRGCTT